MARFSKDIDTRNADALRKAGLRPTRQRLALAGLLWCGHDRHVTAETLFQEACAAGIKVALGTVYNTLHQFTRSGLLRALALVPGHHYFDTNLSDHCHLFDQELEVLIDIEKPRISLKALPALPQGTHVTDINLVIHVSRKKDFSL